MSGNYYSLPEILTCDEDLTHTPAIGFLGPMQHELLASIIQWAVDSYWKDGLSKSDYQRLLLSTKVHDVIDLIDVITLQIKRSNGFSLAGYGSFMQMPNSWRQHGRIKPVSDLLWPYTPKRNSSENGLRCMEEYPLSLGPDLTCLLLYTFNLMSRGYSQFWSQGLFSNSPLFQVCCGGTIRQQLFSSVLPGFVKAWRPLQPNLAWIANCKNNGGLNDDNRPPFLPYLTTEQKIKGTANVRFAWSRAISLTPPKSGICSISGYAGDTYQTFHLLSEKKLHNILKDITTRKLPKISGIMRSMISENVNHPALSAKPRKLPQKLANFGLLTLMNSNAATSLQIAVDIILCKYLHLEDIPLKLSLFSVEYAPKREVVVNGVQSKTYLLSTKNLEHEKSVASFIVESVQKRIRQMSTAIFYFHTRETAKATHSQSIDISIQNLLSYAEHHLWHRAAILFDHLKTNNSTTDVEKEILLVARKAWNTIETRLFSEITNPSDYRAYFQACNRTVWRKMDPSITSEKVAAGRAFAKAYKSLTRAEQNRMQDANLTGEVYTLPSYWACLNKAIKQWPLAYQPIFELFLSCLDSITPVENDLAVGKMLLYVENNTNITVESVFSANGQTDLICIIADILSCSSARVGNIDCDCGILLHDIIQYHFIPSTVLRRWAASLYLQTIEKDKLCLS